MCKNVTITLQAYINILYFIYLNKLKHINMQICVYKLNNVRFPGPKSAQIQIKWPTLFAKILRNVWHIKYYLKV